MTDPFAPPPGHCPKCAAPCDPELLTCPKCGVVFVNFIPEEHLPAPELQAQWRSLLSAWEDPAAHQRFLDQAGLIGQLPQAARLYQIRASQFPEDARALEGKEAVLKRVSATLIPTPRPEAEVLQRRKWALLAAALLLLSLLSWMALSRLGSF